jgi:UDP-glucuronate 4-epimerase
MNVLITGYAGFIGFHTTIKLLNDPNVDTIYCVDDLNDYYDVSLKIKRIKELKKNTFFKKIKEYKFNIKDNKKIIKHFYNKKIDVVINLAAQAGIRYSFINPSSYVNSNIIGFFNILELARINNIKKIVYASTSSSYGNQTKKPYKENYMNNTPLQIYAATKISNELMAYSYSHLYKISCIGLRFFTVYGPWGRPDMAIFKFTDNLFNNKKINLYGKGKMLRDFTYIDDIVSGIIKCVKKKNIKYKDQHNKYFNIYNIGCGKPVEINTILDCISNNLGKKFKINYQKKHSAEMDQTHCSIDKFKKEFNYKPNTKIEDGIFKFITWYNTYNK